MQLNHIKIGARNYQIKFVDDHTFYDFLLKKSNDKNYFNAKSFIDYDEQIIVIRDSLQEDHKQELLLHELLHACVEDAGFIQDFEVEKFISALAPRLNQLLDLNFKHITTQ